MGGLQSTERSLSVTASKGLSALRAAPDLCCAVNQRLTSVVREIRTLRSVGAGGSAPGDPVSPDRARKRVRFDPATLNQSISHECHHGAYSERVTGSWGVRCTRIILADGGPRSS